MKSFWEAVLVDKQPFLSDCAVEVGWNKVETEKNNMGVSILLPSM